MSTRIKLNSQWDIDVVRTLASGKPLYIPREKPREPRRALPPEDPDAEGRVAFLAPYGVSDHDWWDFLHRLGFVPEPWNARPRRWVLASSMARVLGWVGALARWTHSVRAMGVDVENGLMDAQTIDILRTARRALRVAAKDEAFAGALDVSWRRGGWPAVAQFVRGYDFSRKPRELEEGE